MSRWVTRLPDPHDRFFTLFRTGRFREAGNVLEEHWRPHRNNLDKALIQVAIAINQCERGNTAGTRKLLQKSRALIGALGEDENECGFDLHDLGQAIDTALATPNPDLPAALTQVQQAVNSLCLARTAALLSPSAPGPVPRK